MTPFDQFTAVITLLGLIAQSSVDFEKLTFVTALIGAIGVLWRWMTNKIDKQEIRASERESGLQEQIESNKTEAKERENSLKIELTAVRAEFRELEQEIRGELLGLIRETNIALRENTAVLRGVIDRSDKSDTGSGIIKTAAPKSPPKK